MIRDVFYYGKKPNVHPREKFAKNLADARQQCTTEHFWIINEFCNYRGFDWDFDFEFLPDEDVWAAEHNNVWPSQHQKDSGTWLCNRRPSEVIIYRADVEVVKRNNIKTDNWTVSDLVDDSTFDYSWHPDPTCPPYIYQFGTILDDNDGPRYKTPNTNGEVIYLMRVECSDAIPVELVVGKYYIETTLDNLINAHPNEVFWALNKDIDYSDFDFEWRPEVIHIAWESAYVSVFGSPDSETTHTYFVNAKSYLNGNTNLKFIEDVNLNETNLSKLFVKPDIFFIDRGNPNAQERFNRLKLKFPSIQKTRYLNSWVDTINRCINRASTSLCWILNSELDYTDFDFDYYPNPWQMKMVHVFGTQWSHWGSTFMVNRESFSDDTKYVKIIEHLSNLNFVKNRTAIATSILYDMIYIDHGNLLAKEYDALTAKGITLVKYEGSYLTTFKKLLEKLPTKKEHYVWVASTVCDNSGFDFTYICDPFAREQLHVFPSDKQKFGDTFLINVNKLRELISDAEKLDDCKINYNQHQRVKRLPAPTVIVDSDTHVSDIVTEFDFPYAVFKTKDNAALNVVDTEPISLWSAETKNIVVTSTGGTRIIVPKEAKDYVKRELYDYPYIITNSKLVESTPMDIVFLSNGEVGADENYEHLLKVTNGLKNRVVRVDGVNGRVQAYHAAVEASNTPWAFTVFAKLKVSPKFDWSWQPDRLQLPKHYVFYAKNPVNGLVYGHQAMIAYNKKLTLANDGSKGLDFTQDDEHEIVELLSGTANFNTDEYSTWRAAFREVIKLRKEDSEISNKRMSAWLTKGDGAFGEFSIKGANDAIEYYDSVSGDVDKLKLSYEWDWLRKYYDRK